MAAGNMLRVTQGLSLLNVHTPHWNASCRCISNRLILEKLGLPEKPKKPPTQFILYSLSLREEMQKKNPDTRFSDVIKKASEQWKQVSKEEKEKYLMQFKRNYEQYKTELEKYNNSLTPKQKQEIKEAQEDIKTMKQQKLIKLNKEKREKELNKPKHPLIPFMTFVAKHAGQQRKDESRCDFLKKLSVKWAGLPESEKQKYMNEYKEEIDVYQNKLEKWEEEMIRLGNLDLVRLKTLKKKLKIYSE